jgi:hypothetical protein
VKVFPIIIDNAPGFTINPNVETDFMLWLKDAYIRLNLVGIKGYFSVG